MYSEIQKKREERVAIVSQAQELLKKDTLTKDDEQKFDAMMADSDKLKADIDRMERYMAADEETKERVEMKAGRENISAGQAEQHMQDEDKIFKNWVRFGMLGLKAEDQQVMMNMSSQAVPTIYGAQSVGTTTAGGFTVPDESMKAIEDAQLAHGGMRAVSQVVPTGTGADLPFPTSNDTGETGEIIAENTAQNEQDIVFGQLILQAYMYSSKIVLVSLQLLQDSSVNLDSFVFGKLGTRVARITNTHFTTGTGSSQPKGVVVGSTLGKTGAGGQTTTVIYDDLVDLEHSVDSVYRQGANWMFNDSTLKAIKKLKDGNGLPLWSAGLAVREPDTILGYKYQINNDVAVMAASAKSILFGNFSKYLIRDVTGTTVLRLTERYAEKLQVGFIAFSRHDGDLLDAGTNPIKHYINAAT